ncbi:hypothetical protein [Sinorhizobium glycinis]|uniref:hypothetical protein n=1 Tax=Sinorhizobium glycinis TaxID=1472378 RepID=UPI000B1E4677|nr:hypothetical protein [Sinorhizobium glycinis]
MADSNKRSEDPAEGSRETIERELTRREQDSKPSDSAKPVDTPASKDEHPPDEKQRT